MTDIELLKAFYKEGDLPVDVSRKIAKEGFVIGITTALVKLKKLGYKTLDDIYKEKKVRIESFLRTVSERPTAKWVADYFGIGESNASSIIVEVLGYKTRYDNSNRSNRTTQAEKEYLSKLLTEHQEFEANRVWPIPTNIIMHAPILKRHGMI